MSRRRWRSRGTPWDERAPVIEGLSGLEQIGRGASSLVFRAYDAELRRSVAVKVLLADDQRDPARRRFERELEITANLGKHPHIVQVLGTGFTNSGSPYVAMELFEQGSIADHLKRTGTMPPLVVTDIGVKIADAVAAAHRAGVLHRDIKPQNILLSEYGPALADFGIARSVTSQEWSQSLDQLTPMHAAPEILAGEDPSPASDLYSLGSTLYTMLSGRPPFAGPPGESVLQLQLRVMENALPPLPRLDVPQSLVDVLRRSMAKRPEDRYASATEMGSALTQVKITAAGDTKAPTPQSDRARQSGVASSPLGISGPPVLDDLGDETTSNVPFRAPAGGSSGSGAPRVPPPSMRGDTLPPLLVAIDTPEQLAPVPAASHGALVQPERLNDDVATSARARQAPPPDTSSAPPARSRRHRRVIVSTLGVVALLAIGGAVALAAVQGGSGGGGRKHHFQDDYTTQGAPTDVAATVLSSGSAVQLRWTNTSSSVESFEILKSSPQGTNLAGVAPAKARNKILSGTTGDTPYCFIVNAILSDDKLAPGCTCINGGTLVHEPPGFPAHVCPS